MELSRASVVDRSRTGPSTSWGSESGECGHPANPLADIRDRFWDPSNVKLGVRLLSEGLERLRLAPLSARGGLFGLVAGTGLRLLLPLILTAVAGQWSGIPLWRWAVVAAALAAFDLGRLRHHAPSVRSEKEADDFVSLLGTIPSESDLGELARFARRWYRLPVSAAVAAVLTAAVLLACWLATPEALVELGATIAILAVLLYDVGELAFVNLFDMRFLAREARYEHLLFWLDPVNSREVRRRMRLSAAAAFVMGLQMTIALALAVALVSPTSPVVVPLAAGITLIGYSAILASMAAVRSSMGRIVQGVRARHVTLLQDRISSYGPRIGDLTASEAREVEHLVALYDALRDTSSSPSWARSVGHAVAALVVPTLMFVITVFGEVSAERILHQLFD